MPVIPTYQAQGVAQTRQPVKESGQTPRVNVSDSINALGRLANQVSGGGVALPNVDHGQGVSTGIQNLGQGVQNLGSAMMHLREREQEARDISDIHDAKMAMEAEIGKLAEWQAGNPDPRRWNQEASNRLKGFSDAYTSGRDLSPKAKDAIKRYMDSTVQRETISVGMASAKATFAKAGGALRAEYDRAIDEMDFAKAAGVAEIGYKDDYWGEDTAVRMQLNARDTIKDKRNGLLQTQKETAIMYGDIEAARGFVAEMDMLPKEKALELAHITQRHERNALLMEADNMISISPDDAIKAFGTKQFSSLRAADKKYILDKAYSSKNEIQNNTLAGIVADIKLGGITNPKEISKRDDFKSLDPLRQLELQEYIKTGAQNDIAKYATLQRSIRGYEPAQDPRGFERSEFESAIALGFEGDRADELRTILEEQATGQGRPITATSRTVTDIFSALQKRYDNGELGGYRITGAQIQKRILDDGTEQYTVDDESGDVTFKGFWYNDKKARVIQLSEEDKLRYEEAKKTGKDDFYVDLVAKERAYTKFLQTQEAVERKYETGELTDVEQFEAEIKKHLGADAAKSLESRLQRDARGRNMPASKFGNISNGLFPAPSDPNTDLESLLNATGY